MSELAINGGKALYESLVAEWPNYYPGDFDNLKDVLTSRVYGGIPFPGKYASKCIELVKETMGTKYVTMVTNGSDALVIALKALGILPGDEVITTGYSWVATSGAIVKCNAIPVFADIDPENCCIDPDDIKNLITPKTKAIIVVHLANQICDMDAIMKIARENKMYVIEDCAHAPYAKWNNQCVGTIGDIGTFSFEQSKIITCGEGGMVVTQEQVLYEKIVAYANCGRKIRTEEEYFGKFLGWNHRMTEFQAAILYGQFSHIEEWTNKLQKNTDYLFSLITEKCKYVKPLLNNRKEITSRQNYCVLLKYSCDKIPLDIFCKAVRMEGAELEDRWYLAINDMPLFHVLKEEWPFIGEKYDAGVDVNSFNLKVCRDYVKNHIIWIHYPSYCRDFEQIECFVKCIQKVEENIEELVRK
ncbi:MAG: DegT/DnrJ/EryC1/StrS family aminotransferase [Lachnospiraceae bacterium]